MKKKSPVRFKEEEKTLLMTLNERQRRLFIACKAVGDDGFAIEPLCKFLGVSTKTVCKGIRELRDKTGPGEGRIRKSKGNQRDRFLIGFLLCDILSNLIFRYGEKVILTSNAKEREESQRFRNIPRHAERHKPTGYI